MTKNSLTKYRTKRDFTKTPEPSAKRKKLKFKMPIFVIQKHNASHLHYDFRLEIGGVLVSWAVPKGFPKTLQEKRLAIRTEDHPMAYATFAGIIPAGNYGAGTVEIWDHGHYASLKPEITLQNSLKEGKIEVFLTGNKVKGPYALIKKKDAPKEQWLLIKMKRR